MLCPLFLAPLVGVVLVVGVGVGVLALPSTNYHLALLVPYILVHSKVRKALNSGGRH